MKFRLPTGELRWISLFWAVAGLAGALYFGFVHFNILVAGICGFVLAMTIGIWFQSRACAWTLLILYSVSAIAILIREVLIAHEWLRIAKVLVNVWFCSALLQWLKNSGEE